jgi:hypothetical protein
MVSELDRFLAELESRNGALSAPTAPSGPRYEPLAAVPALPVACGTILSSTRDRKPRARLEAGPCRYDWVPGYSGRRLKCIAHRSHGDGSTVFRQTYAGYDTLADMLKAGVLTGLALQDALRTQ